MARGRQRRAVNSMLSEAERSLHLNRVDGLLGFWSRWLLTGAADGSDPRLQTSTDETVDLLGQPETSLAYRCDYPLAVENGLQTSPAHLRSHLDIAILGKSNYRAINLSSSIIDRLSPFWPLLASHQMQGKRRSARGAIRMSLEHQRLTANWLQGLLSLHGKVIMPHPSTIQSDPSCLNWLFVQVC
ncbi:hypothetical protein DPX16_2836 [Anabarilius grahami]|uniref:Uncharacterized protein n=1 Tax=Anabarilius grahami TaxID=495550 RepID=A0A3N0YWE6_ANAGA|nr:hypothetical protein DPX16_2836 [Anabarilius grahami]